MVKQLEYMKAEELLNMYGIRVVPAKYVKSAEEALRFSEGEAIVLKAIPSKPAHKSKNGMVAVDLKTQDEIRNGFNKVRKAAHKFAPYKILAQKMIKGTEIIIGGKQDSQFGKLVLIGLGGVNVEVFRDFSLRLCPITTYDAESMIMQLKSRSIIAGNDKQFRMLKELLLKTSKLMSDNDISELDLNPVILHDDTYHAVDLRIIE
ncbi:MAG: acetate--CoA ligase family protein [Candidatus Marsarchaeota archaeon]|nr:acetate--CoA ligase family protein [Candidatus Marsarchaeota archaeon]MCL5112443.1 acetate--CoA ligase family protein [Candidatus Marsarchaeota archaeon]